jgi:hypothetical protein
LDVLGTENAALRCVTISEDIMDRSIPPSSNERTPKDPAQRSPDKRADDVEVIEPKTDPPRTTTGPITAPKFGSAGSGGAELEPPTPKP